MNDRHDYNQIGHDDEDEPPGICCTLTSRVCTRFSERCAIRIREVGTIWGISSPMLSSRFRNDMVILEVNGQSN
jgi:hypothetical protein